MHSFLKKLFDSNHVHLTQLYEGEIEGTFGGNRKVYALCEYKKNAQKLLYQRIFVFVGQYNVKLVDTFNGNMLTFTQNGSPVAQKLSYLHNVNEIASLICGCIIERGNTDIFTSITKLKPNSKGDYQEVSIANTDMFVKFNDKNKPEAIEIHLECGTVLMSDPPKHHGQSRLWVAVAPKVGSLLT